MTPKEESMFLGLIGKHLENSDDFEAALNDAVTNVIEKSPAIKKLITEKITEYLNSDDGKELIGQVLDDNGIIADVVDDDDVRDRIKNAVLTHII